jgi:hypothetical protein
MPQSENAYPYGVGQCRGLPSLRFDSSRFLRVPMTVIVGDRDTDRDPGLNKSKTSRKESIACRAAIGSNALSAGQKP